MLMDAAKDIDMQEIEDIASAEFPELVRSLEIFEMSFGEYVRAIESQEPRVVYSAASTEESRDA